jgi:hypothetical protein
VGFVLTGNVLPPDVGRAETRGFLDAAPYAAELK